MHTLEELETARGPAQRPVLRAGPGRWTSEHAPVAAGLYDLSLDEDESYDVAARHPDIVADLRGRVDRLMATMPESIRRLWSDTLARKTYESPREAWPPVVK